MEKVIFTVWNKMGDHPNVQPIEVGEFEYQEAKNAGAGALHKWTIVYPGMILVDINGITIGAISTEMYAAIKEHSESVNVQWY